jgi:hypothetical protein
MSNNTQYETLYGIGLLDDLHNYFPAVLYDSSRFRSVQDLLHYVQTNARNRFDLFSFGQRAYLSSNLEATGGGAASSSAPAVGGGSRSTSPRSATPERRFYAQMDILSDDLGLDNQALSLMNLLNVLGGLPAIPRRTGPAVPNSFMEPVVVRPTAEQIERGSTRAFPSEDTVCAICQDAIPVNQMARRLNVCGHTFHISCIDQWYARDVRCPTCRHDIRESGQPQQQQQPVDTEDDFADGEQEVN